MEVTRTQVKAAIVDLEKLAQEMVENGAVPGMAIAVVYQDEVLYRKGFGVREAGSADLVDEDTVFQLASMSKPIATTVVAALVSDGTVRWDDRVIDHDPGFRMYDPWVTHEVTIRDFFSHRSGLPGSAGNDIEEIGYTATISSRACNSCRLPAACAHIMHTVTSELPKGRSPRPVRPVWSGRRRPQRSSTAPWV